MSRRIVRIRKKIETVNTNHPNVSYYPDKNYKIGFIIPVTSRKRKYKNIEGIDFFRILFTSFLKAVDKSGKYKYSFHLGYDDDDEFFSTNKEKIIEHFKSISIDFKDLELEIFLYEIKNLKSKVGEIWSKLAEYASFDNDYLYQIGDDICIISPKWEDRFIGKLISQNNIGVVGPRDINNKKNILTQSFVHITHLQIFTSYYPKKLKNWYTDTWINDIYNASTENDLKVKNTGGAPRYNVENDKKLFLEVLKETRPILEEYRESLVLEEVVYFKCRGEISFVHEDKRFIGSNRLVKYDYEIEEKIEYCDLKERILEVYKNKEYLKMNRKKIISFSLYGADKRYTENAIINCEKLPIIYPGWIIRIYYDKTVPVDIIKKLKSFQDIELVDMSDNNKYLNKMLWRFLVILDKDIEIFIVRDIDSHISKREKKCSRRMDIFRENFSRVKRSPFALSLLYFGRNVGVVNMMNNLE